MSDQGYLFELPDDDRDDCAEEATVSEPKKKKAPKSKPRPEAAPKEPELAFEEALERLETIVADMEAGELSLEACMKRYEEGTKLRDFCSRSLKQYEERIEVLMKEATTDTPEEWSPLPKSEDEDADADRDI